MNVPRGTKAARNARDAVARDAASVYPFTIRHLICADWEIKALRAGVKRVVRLPLTEENSLVHPGKWAGLMLETGRAKHDPGAQLRARCAFESGKARAVLVLPKIKPSDLFWIQGSSPRERTRAGSVLTLVVDHVRVARVQDITDDEARLEGAGFATPDIRAVWPLDMHRARRFFREAFGVTHGWKYGDESWRANVWVWVVTFNLLPRNIDQVVASYALRP